MLIGDVRPTTIEGIKSLAAQFRKQQGMKHSAALDLAAKAANYTNFKSALRALPARGPANERPYVLLTIYWCDKDKRYQIGRETLKIILDGPLASSFSKFELKQVRGFDNLRMVAPDHYVCDTIASSQTYARERLATAERSLRFMEHTGLRPFRAYRRADKRLRDKLPNSDHTSDWIDRETGHFVLVDEPYQGAPDEAKRASWAKQRGWRIVKTTWPGMYFPYSCDLYVAADLNTGYDIEALAAKIDAMPLPLLEKDWVGESSASWDTFLSPMARTPQDARRARCRGMVYPNATKATLPYSYNMGEYRRRPAGAMSIEDHTEAGRIIKAAVWSGQRSFGAYRRMNSLRSTLEDWMAIEIGPSQLQGPEFFDVYYRETDKDAQYLERATTPSGIIEMLTQLKHLLRTAYPDCAPLRRQLNKIEKTAALLGRLKPRN